MKLTDFIAGGAVSSGLATAYTTLNAGEAIAKGDVVVQGADGNAYWAQDPSKPYAALRPIVQATASAIVSLLAVATGTAIIGAPALFTLSNGNIGVIYAMSGGALFFTAFGVDGATAVAPIQLASDVNPTGAGQALAAIALTGGGFAVAYRGTTYAKIGIYSNAGVVVQALTNVTAINGGNYGFSLAQCSGGNVVLFYAGGYAVYSSTGAVVLAYGAVSGLTASTSVAYAVYPSGTGFAIFGNFTISSTAYATAAFFSSAGALASTVNSGVTCAAGNVGLSTLLSNGNIAVAVFTGSTGSSVTGAIISASSVVGSFAITNATNCYGAALAPFGAGGVVVGTVFGSGNEGPVTAYQIGATGGVVGSAITLYGSSSTAVPGLLQAAAMSDGGVVFSFVASGTTSFARVSPSFTALASSTTLATSAPSNMVASPPTSVTAPPNSPTFIIATGATSLSLSIMASYVQPAQPVGVASAAVAASSPVTAQTLGGGSTRLTFAKSYSVDARTNTPPGQHMSIVGNLAILNGIQ